MNTERVVGIDVVGTEGMAGLRTRGVWLALGVTALLNVGGAALLILLRDRLPSRIAVHWGAGGVPDRWTSLGGAIATTAALGGGFALVALVASLAAPRPVRPVLLALTAFLGTFVPLVGHGTAALQAWVEPARIGSGPLLLAILVTALSLGGAAAYLVHRLATPDRPPVPAVTTPVPASAPRVALASGTRVAFVERIGLSRGLVAIMVTAVVATMLLAGVFDWWMVAVPALLAGLVVVFATATVTVDHRGLVVTSGGVVPLVHEDLARISSAEVGHVNALGEFGGWGWRIALDGRRGFVTRSGTALIVHRHGEPDLVVTVDRADEAAGLLNALKDRVAAA